MPTPEEVETASQAGFKAAEDILSKLDLTSTEVSVAYLSAAGAITATTEMVYYYHQNGHDIRMDKVTLAALAAALAALDTRDNILKAMEDGK